MATDKVRIDKWLWSVRIFKSRSLATDACKSGRVKINEKTVKPSYLVQVGEFVQVRKNGFNFSYAVTELISKRVSATLAQECYRDVTPSDEINKYKNWYVAKSKTEFRDKGTGRPTKRQRREIDVFKEIQFEQE